MEGLGVIGKVVNANRENKKGKQKNCLPFMVDVIELESMTFRTSSECSTS